MGVRVFVLMQRFCQKGEEFLKEKRWIFYDRTMFREEKRQRSMDFATAVWEEDYEQVLQTSFLEKKIAYHSYPFASIILVINNVLDPKRVLKKARELKIFTHIYLAPTFAEEIFSHFQISVSTLSLGKQQAAYPHLDDSWVYYNALAPLAAIYFSQARYLLYCTGDVYLEQPIFWIPEAIELLAKKPIYVANLLWNHKYEEAKEEASFATPNYFLSKKGFSDQLFLIERESFNRPIYSCLCSADQFPRGEVFEKRVFCHMQKEGWLRATYKKGSYIHATLF